MKKIVITLMIAFTAMSSFATEYETVYSCGFEDGETDAISKWNLENATDLKAYNVSNLFFIGTATSRMGSKSLYVSLDNGKTNSFAAEGNASEIALAELNLELSAGDYEMSFDYRRSGNQSSILGIYKERLNVSKTFLSTQIKSALPGVWATQTVNFTLSESAKWITFQNTYTQTVFGTGTMEGLSIDNVIIKKAKSSTSSVSATEEGLIIYGLDGKVRIAGTQARATIYNIGGAKVYEGADREIALPSGIYVVRIGEMAKKVIVK